MQLNEEDREESRIREAVCCNKSRLVICRQVGLFYIFILFLREENPVSIGYVLLSHTATE
jgi:hypothetical protein